jgi:hypothetical protein
MKLTDSSLARIYLANQDKVGRARCGKEEHYLPDMQEVGAERLKMVVLIPGLFIPSRLSWGIQLKLFLRKCSYHLLIFNRFANPNMETMGFRVTLLFSNVETMGEVTWTWTFVNFSIPFWSNN